MSMKLNKLASCILKEISFAVVIVGIFHMFHVDLICVVSHLAVRCAVTLDDIFAFFFLILVVL